MDTQVMRFDMCTLDHKGKVKFTAEGLDIIRALVMKWVSEAFKGEQTALEMAKQSPNPFGANQAAYFRSARSFLTARLVSHLSPMVNLSAQLKTLKEWADESDVPDGWREALDLATQLESADGTLNPAGGVGGTHRGGRDKPTAVDGGHDGAKPAATAHPAPPRHNPPTGRGPRRPNPHGGGASGTQSDR